MEKILRKIVPTTTEKKKLKKISRELLMKVESESRKFDPELKAILVGSASRDTWLRDENDLDIFIKFPLKYKRSDLEIIVERIAKRVLKKPGKRFAEHPYVKGIYDGFEVEIVPCYAVKSADKLKSSVDRTPFHDEYVREHIKGKEDQTRLLKQFLRGINCYGAEAKVEGFSGYLCELLIIKFGSFEKVLNTAKSWKGNEVIDITGAYTKEDAREKFSSPLIFIDPVDVDRNVAGALTEQKFSEFISASKRYLENPSEKFFFPKQRKISKRGVINRFGKRGTGLVAIIIKRPDVIDDILYPQLRKSVIALEKILEVNGFSLAGSDFFVSKNICLLMELKHIEIPTAKLHMGPKVNTEHEENFLSKYAGFEGRLTEPFIMGSRWCIILERRYNNAVELLRRFLSQKNLRKKGMPSHVADSIEKGFEIKINKEVFTDEFLPGLQGYFNPRFPWEF